MKAGGIRLAAFVAVAVIVGSTAVLGSGTKAWAVQTSSWGIVAAPSDSTGTYRPEITYPATGTTVSDAVIVWNRTPSPLTVHLSVLSVSDPSGTYQYSPRLTGLAAGVHLRVSEVQLGPYQQARIPVRIDEPAGLTGPEVAAVAGESQPTHDGVLSVEERLAVLIKSTPAEDVVGPSHRSAGPAGSVLFFGTIGGAFLFIVLVLLDRERRRKDDEVVADAVANAPLGPQFLSTLPPPTPLVTIASVPAGDE